VRPDKNLPAPGCGQLHVVFCRWDGTVWNRTKTVSEAVRTAEHPQNTGHRTGRHGVDTDESRVLVWRANHHGMGLPLDAEIVAEEAFASQQTNVLLTKEGLPDCAHDRVRSLLPLELAQPLGERRMNVCRASSFNQLVQSQA